MMTQYMREHEANMNKELQNTGGRNLEQLRDYHLTQIRFLQHERLVHLLVTLAFAFFLVISLIVTWLYPAMPLFMLDILLLVVNLFYILHYYRLENTVQRWYVQYKELCDLIRLKSTESGR